eukprot:7389945-Prymnesium_polylepis.1
MSIPSTNSSSVRPRPSRTKSDRSCKTSGTAHSRARGMGCATPHMGGQTGGGTIRSAEAVARTSLAHFIRSSSSFLSRGRVSCFTLASVALRSSRSSSEVAMRSPSRLTEMMM